jgi:hypothetical protein
VKNKINRTKTKTTMNSYFLKLKNTKLMCNKIMECVTHASMLCKCLHRNMSNKKELQPI